MTTTEHKELKLKELEELPIAEDFVIPDGLIIPFSNKILIKRIGQGIVKTEAGLLLPETSATPKDVVGIVMVSCNRFRN
jgi:hypothetical protein